MTVLLAVLMVVALAACGWTVAESLRRRGQLRFDYPAALLFHDEGRDLLAARYESQQRRGAVLERAGGQLTELAPDDTGASAAERIHTELDSELAALDTEWQRTRDSLREEHARRRSRATGLRRLARRADLVCAVLGVVLTLLTLLCGVLALGLVGF